MTELPQPQRDRWQPLRAGLVDLFYYDQEEFRFWDGRLLLRGNNGTGKSKVLALTLPFLLDGELSAHRVEPDADPKKRMEWNLLLEGEHPADERLGYTWLEFGRIDEHGSACFCTTGCGLKAVRGRGIAAHWFFTTDLRLGEQLALVDNAGIALSRDRLELAIGTAGSVHRTAREHRRAVDERLFGLGEQRYAALIDLLIRIRAPQLSKRPDERGLSKALTDALPPLDQALIADVAEAFRALEEDRDALAAMVDARDASKRYFDVYRTYASIASRRRAAPPRQAQSTFDRISRELADAQKAHERARAELLTVETVLTTVRSEDDRLRARQSALRESPEARSARELERAAEDARLAGLRAGQARDALLRTEARLAQQLDRLGEAEAHADQTEDALADARVEAAEHAHVAGIGPTFARDVDALVDSADREQLRLRADELEQARRRSIDLLRKLLATFAERRRDLVDLRRRHEQLASEQAELTERRVQREQTVAAAAGGYVKDVWQHLESATELHAADPADVYASLELWVETLAGPNPVDEAVSAAGREATAELGRVESALAAEAGEAQRQAVELGASIARLEAGEHQSPTAPHTRDPATRDGRAGAPLWQVVDFRPGVGEAEQAGIEAALEAAGILDAWVSPDGELLAPRTHDTLLVADASTAPGGTRLHELLEPAIDRDDPCAGALDEPSVRHVLESIGLEQVNPSVWVASDGRFRNGVLRGAWQKPAATFIGHAAREAARRARLEELRNQHAELAERMAQLDLARNRLLQRKARLEDELDRLPGDEALRSAHGELIRIEAELASIAKRVADSDTGVKDAELAAEAVERELRADAEDLHLPVDSDELDAVQRALQAFQVALAKLWPTLLSRDRAVATRDRARADMSAAQSETADARSLLGDAERQQSDFEERHQTLVRTAGAAVAELQRQLGAVAGELRRNERRRDEADRRRSEAQRAEGREDGRRQELERGLEQATEERRLAVDALRRFAGTGLIEVALGELELPVADEEWGVTAALRVARQIEQELSEVSIEDSAWQRAQQRATDDLGVLADALRRHGNNASASLREEGIVVEVTFRGHSTSVPRLAEALSEEVEDRGRLLDEREREILENHLVNEVASTLQELISEAERQLARTNAELADRPTSTGMQLRLRWVADREGPAGLAEARERLLRQAADAWSEEDRTAVGGFLQSRIQEIRSGDPGGTWIEHLTTALDYRAWHRFIVERRQSGVWRSATGPSSGGERVLAASVPLFAAASSYYASASNPDAPRLVMLDEAFAGVDDNARAKCLGLLAAFDLDVVMTSEREWGCYPEVPGLAIAQLARVEDVPAVLVTHWEWDGASRIRVSRADGASGMTRVSATGDSYDGPRLWETSTSSD